VAIRAPTPTQRLTPPDYLSTAEREIFAGIVANSPAKHFTRNDEFLLATYCKITLQIREATDPDALLRAARVQASIAGRLRLTPSSRLDPRTAARGVANSRPPSVYDLMREGDDA
jgi:hypothetical protein